MQLSRVTVDGVPSPAEALDLHKAIFPRSGEYVIKATDTPTRQEEFEEWFLKVLFDQSRGEFQSARDSIWDALDRLLEARGVTAPSDLGFGELQDALFDLGHASTARMVGFHVPEAMRQRLSSIGFTPQEQFDFPAIAYRLGLLYRDLMAAKPAPWAQLVADAWSVPLTNAEHAAVDYARKRAGIFLRPIFDREGQLWTAERELFKVKLHTARALRNRMGAREAGRHLQNVFRAEGIDRDAERVMRTEIAEASNRGAWVHAAKDWTAETKIFRQPSRGACRGCLRLYLKQNGMPRLYRPRAVEEATAAGPNRGPWREWRPQIGATHPNCCCAPFQAWTDRMQPLFAKGAPRWAKLIEELGVFKDLDREV